ncbi:unnamed protein product [Trifolium pratense]|nr:unnamed protein product [Trifolium pratense]
MNTSRKPEFYDAVMYVKKVKVVYRKKKEVYEAFLKLLNDYKANIIDIGAVKEDVMQLFKGRQDLISGFNFFLPKGHKKCHFH